MVKGVKKVRTPGNRLVIHRKRNKAPKSSCSICGAHLFVNNNKKTISGKRPSRPFGGKVCHYCLRIAVQTMEIE